MSRQPDAGRQVALIVAMTPEHVIGRDGELPWHLPADLRHFKATTMGKPLVMGRKTWESIGRPLPGRRNIVVTRNAGYQAPGATVVTSLDEALDAAGEVPELMVIGGAQIYAAALPLANRLYLTLVQRPIAGDTLFPEIDWSQWSMVQRSATQFSKGLPFFFARYQRRPHAARDSP